MEFLGKFITFEGGEGGGKSTQVALLEQAFGQAGLYAVSTREPGGTPTGEKIRKILVTKDEEVDLSNLTPQEQAWAKYLLEQDPERKYIPDLDPTTEVFLHMAARREHLVHKIWPLLKNGTHVISDRFSDSTRAFQGNGMGISDTMLDDLHWLIARSFKPNLTFILDLPAEEGLKRSLKHNDETGSNEDRYEEMGLEFHRKIRRGFNDIAHKNPERCVVIDATQSTQAVHKAIIEEVNKRFHLGLNSVPFISENTPAPKRGL